MPEKEMMDVLFIVQNMKEEYQAKGKKLYMCFVDLKKAFKRVLRRVMEWAMRKKNLREIIVKLVISLYEGAKMKIAS